MWPVLFRIGDFPIASFGLMVALGFLAGYAYSLHYGRRAGLSAERFSNLIVFSLIAALVGAKLAHVLVYWGEAPLLDLLLARSGLVFYGGLIGGVGTGWVLVRKYRWNVAQVADIAAPGIALGLFFGRIGCFLNGCCYGRVTGSSWGVCFPRIIEDGTLVGSEPFLHQVSEGRIDFSHAHSLPVYPTQIFSSLGGLLIFVLLHFVIRRRAKWAGQTALTGLGCYAVWRFGVEALRADPRGVWFGMVSTSQGISLIMLAATVVGWVTLRNRYPLPFEGLTEIVEDHQ